MNIVMMFEVRNALKNMPNNGKDTFNYHYLTNIMKILMDDFTVFGENTALEALAYA